MKNLEKLVDCSAHFVKNFLPLLLFSLIFHCKSSPVAEQKNSAYEKLDLEEQIAAIEQLYRPLSCFYAEFELLNHSFDGLQRVNGTVRGDEEKRRTLFVFQVPFLGIVISRILIEREVVIFKERNGRIQQVPKKNFNLQTSGIHSFALPFDLFDDLLYGRLPEELFSAADPLAQDGQKVVAHLKKGPHKIRYTFHKNRLEHLLVEESASGRSAEIRASGIYRNTKFPRQIEISSVNRKKNLKIRFSHFNLQADCRDRYFTIER